MELLAEGSVRSGRNPETEKTTPPYSFPLWLGAFLNVSDCGAQGAYYAGDFLWRLVFAARPEETFQAVALIAGDYVNVKMRDALTHAIVGGDEGALRLHRSLDGGG